MKYLLFSVFFYSLLVIKCHAQSNAPNSYNVVDGSQNYSHYEELIYLHINTSFFVVGESLLFKAYCLNSTNNTPSKLSTIAYVEVIDENITTVLRAKISLKDGDGSGDFFLPSSLSSGNYTLIAYTQWMMNYSIHNFFKTQITIINPFRKPNNLIQKKKSQSQIVFFPEGGKLISGISNTIAINVTDEKRNGMKCNGKILDDAGNTVVEFSTMQNGIGRFSLTPSSGEKYKAVIIDSLQNIHLQPLPNSINEGMSMQVTENEYAFQINLQSRGLGKNSQSKIVVHKGEHRIFETTTQFNNEQTLCEIKKTLLPFGILQLSVFSINNDMLCERLIFNTPATTANLNITVNKKKFNTREKVIVTLVNNDTLVSHLSISVRRTEKKINNPLLISNYIYRQDSKNGLNLTNKNRIDDQMLVEKPPAYSIKNLIMNQSSIPKYLPEVRNNLISGTVQRKDNVPAAKELVYLSLPSKEYLFFASRTDSSGRFYFNTNKIKSSADIILQVSPATCLVCQIKVDANGLEDYTDFKPTPLEIDTSFQKIIEKRSVLAQIENAYYSQKQDLIIDTPETMHFYGQPDKTYLLDDYVRFPTMEDILIEYVLEIILRKKGNEFEIRVMNLRKREAFNEQPLLLLDGIPIFDVNQIMTFNPLLLKKIEIVGRRYFYGPIETQGIISFTTYDGTGKNISIAQKEKYLGILPRKSYYTPKYDEVSASLTTIPDYRNQLYWNPEVMLSNKPMSFEFYTSDIVGEFEIIVEGIRDDGLPIQDKEIIHVDKN